MTDYTSPQKLRLKKIEKLLNDKDGFILRDVEARIAYLLVEIRKVLEEDDARGKFPYLNLFCNWALHVEINESNMALRVLQKIANSARHRKNSFYWVRAVEGATFVELRRELRLFAKKYRIPATILARNDDWSCFLNKLIFILVDSPLQIQHELKPKIRPVRGKRIISISLCIVPPNNEGMIGRKYGWEHEIAWPWWIIAYDDGTKMRIPCIYSSLGQHSGPNLSGGLIGFGWKYGNLV